MSLDLAPAQTEAPLREPRRRGRWPVWLGVVLVPVGCATAVRAVNGTDPVELVVVAFLAVAAGGLLLSPRGVVSARTWVLGYLVLEFPVRALFLLTAPLERPPIYDAYSPGVGLEGALVRAMLEALVGLIVMLAAYWLAAPRSPAARRFRTTADVRVGRAYALLGLAALLLPVELVGSDHTTSGGGFIVSLPGLAAAGVAAVVCYAFVQSPGRYGGVFVATLGYTGARVLLLHSKLAMLACLVATVVSLVALSGRGRSRTAAVIRSVAVLAIGTLVASYVFAIAAGRTDGKGVHESVSAGVSAAVSRSYGVDAVVASDAHLAAGAPQLHGSTLSELVYSWVPRAVWPGKPKSFSVRFGEEVFAFSSLAGTSFFAPSYSGEWLLNFGLPGLVVGWLLFGLALGRIDALRSLPHRVLWAIAAVHLVEGSVVAQFWLAAPFLLGGYLVLSRIED